MWIISYFFRFEVNYEVILVVAFAPHDKWRMQTLEPSLRATHIIDNICVTRALLMSTKTNNH